MNEENTFYNNTVCKIPLMYIGLLLYVEEGSEPNPIRWSTNKFIQ